MSPDAEIIARSILSLKSNTDVVKDYIFPVAMSFFSALIGAISAHYFFKRQEKFKQEKEKLDSFNSVYFNVNNCLNTLISIKYNYLHINTSSPIERAINFNNMIFSADKVDENITGLSFIRSKPNQDKSITNTIKNYFSSNNNTPLTTKEISKTWRNLLRINMILKNYNFAIELIKVRNNHDVEIRNILVTTLKQDSPQLVANAQMIIDAISPEKASIYVDLTEQSIAIIDFLIVEMDSFLKESPMIAESNIDMKVLKNIGSIPRYTNEKQKYIELVKPMIRPDYTSLGKLLGTDSQSAQSRYTYGEW